MQLFLVNEDDRARAFATLLVAQRRLDDEAWDSLVESLIASGRQYRAAVAAVAAANFRSASFGSIATQWLIRFFDDDDVLVRNEAVDCFRRMGAEGMRTHAGLFEAYASSRHLEARNNYFLFQLKDAPPSLDDMSLGLLEAVLDRSADAERASRAYDLHYAGDLLLRIYASNLDRQDRLKRALDLIDRLVEMGLIEPGKLDN